MSLLFLYTQQHRYTQGTPALLCRYLPQPLAARRLREKLAFGLLSPAQTCPKLLERAQPKPQPPFAGHARTRGRPATKSTLARLHWTPYESLRLHATLHGQLRDKTSGALIPPKARPDPPEKSHFRRHWPTYVGFCRTSLCAHNAPKRPASIDPAELPVPSRERPVPFAKVRNPSFGCTMGQALYLPVRPAHAGRTECYSSAVASPVSGPQHDYFALTRNRPARKGPSQRSKS